MVAKSLDLKKPWSRKYGGEKTKRSDTYDFSVHFSTLGQNGSSHFFSIVRQCKWPSLSRKVVEIHKYCYHGNMTSHFSSPLNCAAADNNSFTTQWYLQTAEINLNVITTSLQCYLIYRLIVQRLHSTSLNWELYYTNFNNCGCYAQHK